jgi:hypothetical protein
MNGVRCLSSISKLKDERYNEMLGVSFIMKIVLLHTEMLDKAII